MPSRILFVCLGNICRSPAALGVFRALAGRAGIDASADSAGTGNWHAGEPPDPRMVRAAGRRGYDLSGIRARQVREGDFTEFTHLLAMDRSNLRHLVGAMPAGCPAHVGLFLDYHAAPVPSEVPDPYHAGPEAFETVLDLIEAGARGLVATLGAAPRNFR